MATVRKEIWYQGHVQGVGFRFTVVRIAQQFPVNGYVENLADGRVHLVCEGAAAELDEFLREVSDRMGTYIRDTRLDTRPGTGEFTGFQIRH